MCTRMSVVKLGCSLGALLCINAVLGKGIPKIAIIGGGIGGSSAAYFLEDLFESQNVKIDIYEPNKIGGRLAIENIGGNFYEIGGSIIHPRNKYMVEFADSLGLKKRSSEPSKFGLYDGKEFVFSEDSSWETLNTLKFLWRYGLGALKLQHFIDGMLDRFDRIYTLQMKRQAFDTVEELLVAMSEDFIKDIHLSTEDGFEEDGFSERIISELIAGTLLVNFGQTTDAHKFVGAVSVAGGTDGLWAIEGGNRLAAEKLLQNSKASLVNARVANITLNPEEGTFQISLVSGEPMVYDIVILAMPMVKNTDPGINFFNFPNTISFQGQYHKTVSTLVLGDVNNTYFGMEHDQIQEIFLIKNTSFFRSVGRTYPVNDHKDSDHHVWKVFSSEELTEEQLKTLFVNIYDVKSKQWFAYPHYSVEKRTDKFTLFDNLYHVNAIEWAASAMEMSVIGAKNVALLAYNNWYSMKTDHVKDEL